MQDLLKLAISLLKTYEFKMHDVLDVHRHCIPTVQANTLRDLQKEVHKQTNTWYGA